MPGALANKWEREATDVQAIDGVPLTRYWLIPSAHRPRVHTPHPRMTADELRSRTQEVWDQFYAVRLVWQRSRFLKTLRARLAFVLLSCCSTHWAESSGLARTGGRGRTRVTWPTGRARRLRTAARGRVTVRAIRRRAPACTWRRARPPGSPSNRDRPESCVQRDMAYQDPDSFGPSFGQPPGPSMRWISTRGQRRPACAGSSSRVTSVRPRGWPTSCASSIPTWRS
jgi:hypothetical protein